MVDRKLARRPATHAVTFDEVGAAIGRLVDLARSDTGQAGRAADFSMTWRNGSDAPLPSIRRGGTSSPGKARLSPSA